MNHHTLFAFLAVLTALTGMGAASEQKPINEADERGIVDLRILDTVLVDVVTHKEPAAISLPKAAPRDVFFSGKRPASIHDVLAPMERTGWEKLPLLDRKQVESAAKNLQMRFGQNDAFRQYTPSDKRIHRKDDDFAAADNAPYQASFPAKVCVPGYSDSGTVAVMYVSFPELHHPSTVVYVLERTDGKWKIIWRGSVTYL